MSLEDTSATRAPSSERARIPDKATGEGVGVMVRAMIDGEGIRVLAGTTILQAAEELGIRIPTLCQHPDLCIAGLCRVCVVEVAGQRVLQAACSYPILAPVEVRTHSRAVRRARQHVIELMLARHQGDCNTCVRNGNCELQELARDYGIDRSVFAPADRPMLPLDRSSVAVVRDENKCVLCRRCTRTCVDLQEVGALEAAGRSHWTRVSTFASRPLAEVVCISCGQCINRCPTGALQARDDTDEVWAAIDDPQKHVVIQTAPAPRAAIGEEFGEPPGTALTFQLNTALRRCGFDRVFDTNFTADLTIIEEGTELLQRLRGALVDGDAEVKLPMFTSCSPGWVKFLEHFFPELIGHLSSAKSPQQMFGALLKTYYAQLNGLDPEDVVSVSLMPCTAKKFEASRPEMVDSGLRDVDHVLTTRELAKMLREANVDLPRMLKSDFDDPFGTATGSGVIFGATGGVMESAIRTVVELVCGVQIEDLFENAAVVPVRGFSGVKYAELPITRVGEVPPLLRGLFDDWGWLEGKTLKVGVCHGTANAKRVLEDVRSGGTFSGCHFIEFMACPGGCLGGGGMPIPTSAEIRAARARAIYAEDEVYDVRKSHLNPAVAAIYERFFTEGPAGHKSHLLLHTGYTARGRLII